MDPEANRGERITVPDRLDPAMSASRKGRRPVSPACSLSRAHVIPALP